MNVFGKLAKLVSEEETEITAKLDENWYGPVRSATSAGKVGIEIEEGKVEDTLLEDPNDYELVQIGSKSWVLRHKGDNREQVGRCAKEVRHQLTAAEKQAMADKVAQADSTRVRHENELKDLKNDAKAKKALLDAATDKLSDLLAQYREGYEMRSVECVEVRDYDLGELLVIADETGEIVERRALGANERQPSLPMAGEEEEPDADEAMEPEEGEDAPGGLTVVDGGKAGVEEEA